MIDLIKNNISEIQDVCKKHHVKSLYLFGSAARERTELKLESDVDFLYQFNKHEIGEMFFADNYFSFLFSLQVLLKRKVDLVPEEKLRNPYFIQSINKSKLKLYES